MSSPEAHFIPSVPGLSTPPGYSYAASATGELVFFAGQVALDKGGTLVGPGDFEAQVRQTFANLRLALAEAGCTPAGVLVTRYYVVGLSRERLLAIRGSKDELFAGSKPASTLIGVAALANPEALFEVEVVAVRAAR
jgi:enamine deaminase RidA (YjgF/YER057c/UK114 family)